MMKDSNLSSATKLTSLACGELCGGPLCSRELSRHHHSPKRCRVCPYGATTNVFGEFLGAELVLCVHRS